ncbi:TPA: ABC transporter permease [Candidatus Bipolaricaulota bacterium]|nr:ABC transporter permease [Candidatus Bipolaricaulota bacterium]
MAFWRRPGFQRRWDTFKRGWYKFSKNPVSVVGLFFVVAVSFLAVFAPFVAPYPEHAGRFVNFSEASQPPSLQHPFGTDVFGRDILSRVFFGFRYSLMMGVVVLVLVVPPGVVLGLVAGYWRGTWIDMVIMRVTDVFLAVPPLILALAVCSVLTPSVFNAMMAVSLMWWPWYARLVYGLASSLRNEFFVQAAEVAGASRPHILFREILPNCVSSIFTKMSLDMGWVILIGSALSFVGLGAQPPTPDLGTMVADGAKYLPDQWWIAIFPALAIMITVLGFNLIGDGFRDLFALEEV